MGGLKTHILAISLFFVAAVPVPGPAGAMPTEDGQLKAFATCAGRLSALMEHQWMFDGPASEDTQVARAQLVDILEALMPPGRGREVLAWRVEAKMAHAMLLARATFAAEDEARWAARTADRLVAACRSYLLS